VVLGWTGHGRLLDAVRGRTAGNANSATTYDSLAETYSTLAGDTS